MLRNLNLLRDNKRICGTPQVGVLGSTVPGNGLLFGTVQSQGLSARQVRLWVASSTFPAGSTLRVNEDSSWTMSGVPAGSYTVTGRLFVDDVDKGLITVPLTVATAATGAALRNLNQVRDGKRICGTPKVGVQAIAVPTIGPPFALLYNDIEANGYGSNLLRLWIESSNFPAGSLTVYENSSYLFTGSPIANGTYSAMGRLFVDDVDQGTAAFRVTVGG